MVTVSIRLLFGWVPHLEMLKPKLFPQVLEQANTDGVVCSMYGVDSSCCFFVSYDLIGIRVTTTEGAMIAYAGDKNEKEVAAISASVFSAYEKLARSVGEEDVEFFIINNEVRFCPHFVCFSLLFSSR